MTKAKITLLSGTIFLILVAVFLLFTSGMGQSPDFQQYKPAILPNALKTTSGEFYVLRNKGFLPTFKKHINIHLDKPNSWIAQWKSDGVLTNTCRNISNHDDCKLYTTNEGQIYQLRTNKDEQTNEYAYDVRFIKASTEIWITLHTDEEINQPSWSRILDSFEPHEFSNLEIKRGSASGP